jgi:hypothetical protein
LMSLFVKVLFWCGGGVGGGREGVAGARNT